MADLEKTIKSLEHCYKGKCVYEDGERCPYERISACTKAVLSNAIELLKEKQPRLLTLEEVKQAEVVWNEWTSVDGFVECMMFDRVDADGDYRFTEKLGSQIYFEPSEYNESWRCWSARPTDEQMKETEWDGEQ